MKTEEDMTISISKQHAYSLSELVKMFKVFIDNANLPDTETRKDEWTKEYCDELLKDLND